MSREILFKAKRSDNREWIEGNIVWSNDAVSEWQAVIIPKEKSNMFLNIKNNNMGFESWYLVDPKTICEYTGLTDKNGRKIFEGDIITYQYDNDDCPFSNKDTKRRVGRVYFQEFRSCFAVAEGRNGSDRINQDLFKYVQNGNRVEVIGNIFDNPELLKECTREAVSL